MQYYKCKCGKAEYFSSGCPPQDCQGCDECGSTFGLGPKAHPERIPHDPKPQFSRETGELSHYICSRCYELVEAPRSEPSNTEWQQYRRKGLAEMRPYVKGEDLTGISVSDVDDPETDMGMIARNPKNHTDQWYVARQYFEDNFEPAE